MIAILADQMEAFQRARIPSLIEQHRSIFNDPLIQYHLIQLGTDSPAAFILYLQRLRSHIASMSPLHSASDLAQLFSSTQIPTCTPLLVKFKQLAELVDLINEQTQEQFRDCLSKLRRQECLPPPAFAPSEPKMCICRMRQKKLETLGTVIMCILCKESFHQACIRMGIDEKIFVCPYCIIRNLDPLTPVQETLAQSLFEVKKLCEQSQTITFQVQHSLQKDQSVEIRSICLDEQRYEMAWPEIGDLILNGNLVMDFKPLSSKSTLKHRRDEKYVFVEATPGVFRVTVRQQAILSTQRKLFRVSPDKVYLFGAYLVCRLSPERLISRYLNNQRYWVTVDQMKDCISLFARISSGQEVKVDKVAVSLQCQLTLEMIKTPVRGVLCEHIQCFSLESMCKLMASHTQRKWACPICKKICLEIFIDSYQVAILKQIRSKIRKRDLLSYIDTVQFDCNGNLMDFQFDVPNPEEKEIIGRNILYELLYVRGVSLKTLDEGRNHHLRISHGSSYREQSDRTNQSQCQKSSLDLQKILVTQSLPSLNSSMII